MRGRCNGDRGCVLPLLHPRHRRKVRELTIVSNYAIVHTNGGRQSCWQSLQCIQVRLLVHSRKLAISMSTLSAEWCVIVIGQLTNLCSNLAVNVDCYFLKFVIVSGPMFVKLFDVSYVY